jgi:hypothetical protein
MESKNKQCGIKLMLLANAFTISVDHGFGGVLLASVIMTVTVSSAKPSCLKATIPGAIALLIFSTSKELSSCQHRRESMTGPARHASFTELDSV